jgi:hypothetical protein
MTSIKQQEKATKLLDFIEKKGVIQLYDLLDGVGFDTVDWYNNGFGQWFLYRYGSEGNNTFSYDKKSKKFTWTKRRRVII